MLTIYAWCRNLVPRRGNAHDQVILNNGIKFGSHDADDVENLCGSRGCECFDEIVLMSDDATLEESLVCR